MDTKISTDVSNKNNLILQNGRVTAFTVSELLKENQQGSIITHPTHFNIMTYSPWVKPSQLPN